MSDENHTSIGEPGGEPLPPTRLCDYKIKFEGGYKSDEQAQEIAARFHSLANSVSRYFPLERLDGVTFAADYAAALANLDRGFGAVAPLTPTAESFAVGVAMSPSVLREGVAKTHIVLNTGVGLSLISEDKDLVDLATHLIFHELIHVSYNQMVDEAMPGIILKPFKDQYEGALYRHACECVDEYIATNHSSFLGKDLIYGYRETLIKICEQSRDRLIAARNLYRNEQDYIKLSDATFSSIGSIMKFSGYLLGQADGESVSPFDDEGKLDDALTELGLRDWFDVLHQHLIDINEKMPNWSGLEDFFTVNRSLEEAARIHGVHPSRENDQLRVDIETKVFWMDL